MNQSKFSGGNLIPQEQMKGDNMINTRINVHNFITCFIKALRMNKAKQR